ncbi:hypothetical protein [Dyadobacter sp. 676]|uniref:Uncharacterized protein n=1 Tax=Dyadobacter sp. 676 TaxID=3088362 RepID=A0AAU8FP56_9BACT
MTRIFKTFQLLLVILNISNAATAAGDDGALMWEYTRGDLALKWDLAKDKAVLTHRTGGSVMWQGSLLPSLWYENPKKEKKYSKAVAKSAVREGDRLVVSLQWPGLGKGRLVVDRNATGWRYTELSAEWAAFTPKIIEMYLGASLATNGTNVQPTWARPFMPDWQSFGYCVPGAKAGTVQSYFRSWDFGHATIALGNFGPSMGTPYGAAFPRPVLFAGMGSDGGWLTVGAGSVPEGAMSLKIQSTRGCFQFLYREDLWGGKKRPNPYLERSGPVCVRYLGVREFSAVLCLISGSRQIGGRGVAAAANRVDLEYLGNVAVEKIPDPAYCRFYGGYA